MRPNKFAKLFKPNSRKSNRGVRSEPSRDFSRTAGARFPIVSDALAEAKKMATSLRRGPRPELRWRSTMFRSSIGEAVLVSVGRVVEIKHGEIGIVSGITEEHLSRRVGIYSPTHFATQQGLGKVGRWKIIFLSAQKWENPLIGWTSTGDSYANVGDAGLSFDGHEIAGKAFAERHGWKYVVTHFEDN